MNRKWIAIALAALLVPSLARTLWLYNGVPVRPEVATPDYVGMTMPAPPIGTPQSVSEVKTQTGSVVLLDYAHANLFQPNEIQPLLDQLQMRGARVELNTDPETFERQLKYASSLLVISPNTAFTADEIRLSRAFVERGGHLAVFTDPTRGTLTYDFFSGSMSMFPDVNAANPLLAPFGLSINGDYLYNLLENEGNFRNVYFDQFNKDELTFGLSRVTLYGTHSVRADGGKVLFLAAEQTVSSLNDAAPSTDEQVWGAAALDESGKVLAFGDFTFLTSPYQSVTDNATLMGNIADFLLAGEQETSLVNFPYLFRTGSVDILPLGELTWTPELVSAVGGIQSALQTINVDTRVTTRAPVEGNLIVLGTFTPDEDLLPFLEAFHLDLTPDAETISIPGFGEVTRSGNALLLFEAGRRGNTLVMLTDTPEDMLLLLEAMGNDLSGCFLQAHIGVCGLGYSDSSSSEEDTSSEEQTTSSSEGETQSQDTPTPPG